MLQLICYLSVTELVPADIQQEVRQLYCALCELMHHFWACFPVTSKEQEEKVRPTTTTTTTTGDRYPLKSFGPGRLLATLLCLLCPSLRPLMFESVFLL